MDAVFEALEKWRNDTAEEEGVDRHHVLGNGTLRAIAERNPGTVEDLLEIKGIGPGKAEKYGEAILEIIAGETTIDITIGGKTSAWKRDTHFPLPSELCPFVEDSDKFFSPMKQQAMAEKRRAAKEGPFTIKSNIITSAFDLLILREKRKEKKIPNLAVSFTVCGRTASLADPKYELVLAAALSFIDSCLYLEDAEGKPLSKYVVAERLKAIGVPLPEGYAEFRYLEDYPVPSQSYWADAANYAHLTKLRHGAMDEA